MESTPKSTAKSNKKKIPVVYCFVPFCSSNSITHPDKRFLTVPQEPKLREKWMKAARRDIMPTAKSVVRCCEDHFDLENDMDNWMRVKLMGGSLVVKKDVLPHIFHCQEGIDTTKPLPLVTQRTRKHDIFISIRADIGTKLGIPFELPKSNEDNSGNDTQTTDQPAPLDETPHNKAKSVSEPTTTPINNIESPPEPILIDNNEISPLNMDTTPFLSPDSVNNNDINTIDKVFGEDTNSTLGLELSDILDSETDQNTLGLQLGEETMNENSLFFLELPNSNTELNTVHEAIVPFHAL